MSGPVQEGHVEIADDDPTAPNSTSVGLIAGRERKGLEWQMTTAHPKDGASTSIAFGCRQLSFAGYRPTVPICQSDTAALVDRFDTHR